uniref:Uncharacterized protein n=1 Tax=Ixodes scapularis TaxID=6945 RepID=A0A4D5RX49_IXOSC
MPKLFFFLEIVGFYISVVCQMINPAVVSFFSIEGAGLFFFSGTFFFSVHIFFFIHLQLVLLVPWKISRLQFYSAVYFFYNSFFWSGILLCFFFFVKQKRNAAKRMNILYNIKSGFCVFIWWG